MPCVRCMPMRKGDLIAENHSSMSRPATPSVTTGLHGSLIRPVLAYCIVAAFVILCAHYVFRHWNDFAFVTAVSFPAIVAAGLLVLCSYVLNAYQLSLFLRNFKVSLGFAELMALTTGMLLGNLLIPMRGGTGGLALYLKRVHDLDFGSFAAIYAGTAVLIALINSGLAITALVLLGWLHNFSHPALSIFVVGIFACCLYLSLFPPPIRWKRSGLLGLAFRAARSWHLLTRNRRLLLALALSFLAMAFSLMSAFLSDLLGTWNAFVCVGRAHNFQPRKHSKSDTDHPRLFGYFRRGDDPGSSDLRHGSSPLHCSHTGVPLSYLFSGRFCSEFRV